LGRIKRKHKHNNPAPTPNILARKQTQALFEHFIVLSVPICAFLTWQCHHMLWWPKNYGEAIVVLIYGLSIIGTAFALVELVAARCKKALNEQENRLIVHCVRYALLFIAVLIGLFGLLVAGGASTYFLGRSHDEYSAWEWGFRLLLVPFGILCVVLEGLIKRLISIIRTNMRKRRRRDERRRSI